jgi:hypothetical protein
MDQVPGDLKKTTLNTHNNILRTLKLEQYMITRGKIRVKYERKLKHLKINTGVKIDKVYCRKIILFQSNSKIKQNYLLIIFKGFAVASCLLFSIIKETQLETDI